MDIILSDIHANLQALRAVLRHTRRRAVHRWVILGDLIGYGAHPNQVLDRVQELRPRVMVRGNHDRACSSDQEELGFSLPARQSAFWTRERLSLEHLHWVRELPMGPLEIGPNYCIAHGSPQDEDGYLLHPRDALEAFQAFQGSLCFFGHTHLPGYFEWSPEHAPHWTPAPTGEWVPLKPDSRYLVNPGSVGQPRDRDHRVSFMTFDPLKRRMKWHRLDYDHRGAARAILAAGLHPNLAERLHHGL